MTRSTSHADEQSAKRSSSVAAKVVRAPSQPEHAGARQPGGSIEGRKRPVEAASPAVRGRERRGALAVVDGEPGERTQPLAVGRGRLERPREAGQRSPLRRARDLSVVEERPDVLPERARLARHPVVGGGLAREHEPPGGARARGVEEVAIARDRVDALEPPSEVTARVVVQKRRRTVTPRERALLEAEQDHDVEVTGTGPAVVENGDVSCFARRDRTNGRPLERGDDGFGPERAAVAAREGLELVQRPGHGLVCAGVRARVVGRRRSLQAPGGARHRPRQLADGGDRVLCLAQPVERRQRSPANPLGLLRDALGLRDRAPPETALDEVHGAPLEPRERRAQIAEEVAAPALEPREPQKAEQRSPECRLPQPRRLLDRERDPERDENGVEHRPPAIHRVADDADPLRGGSVPEQLEHLCGDELRCAACTGALEEPERAVERRRRRWSIGEQLPLEVDERRGDAVRAHMRRPELLDRARSQSGEIPDRALE